MEIRHDPVDDAGGRDGRVLASNVEVAESLGEQTKGLMFREELPADYAMVFRFGEPPWWTPKPLANLRSIHMLFVKMPLDVLWLHDGVVQRVSTLSPWTGFGLDRADTIVELPAGAADGVSAGDRVTVVEDE